MMLTLRMFGLTVVELTASTDDAGNEDEYGDCTTTPLGFTASPGDQRWGMVACPDGDE